MNQVKFLLAGLAAFIMAVAFADDAWKAPSAKILSVAEDAKLIRLPDLSREPEPAAKIVYHGSVPGIEVNGEVLPPYIFRCNDLKTVNDSDMVAKMGLSGVRIIDLVFMMDSAVREDGSLDLGLLDRRIKRILTLYPDARIIIGLRFAGMEHVLKKHPEAAIEYASGKADTKRQLGRFIGVSAASEIAQAEFLREMDEVAKFIKAHDWEKRVIGFRLSWAVYGEWHYYGMQREMPDVSPNMDRAFCAYLKELYKTDEALQKAWNNSAVTLETARVPGKEVRLAHKGFLLDPAKDKMLWDYRECHQKVVADLLLMLAKRSKENFPNRLVGAYYGYAFGLPDPSVGQTLMLDRVLGSPYIDFLSCPVMYWQNFRHNGGSGRERNMPQIAVRYGKLSIAELDTRTHLAVGSDVDYQSSCNPRESEMVMRRGMANALFANFGVQFLHVNAKDPDPSWFNSPEILTAIHSSIGIWKTWFDAPPQSNSDVAVVHSPWELATHGASVTGVNNGIPYGWNDVLFALDSCGFGYDILTPEDFLLSPNHYKAVLFMNFHSPTPELAAKVRKRLDEDKSTAIWCYAPGLVTPDGFSNEAMSRLAGIELSSRPEPFQPRVRFTDGRVMQAQDERFLTEFLRTFSVDKNAEVLARYTDNNEAAVVKKNLASGAVSIFTAILPYRSDVLAEFFRAAGAHQYTEIGQQAMRANSDYFMLHKGTGGSYVVQLPGKVTRAVDCYSGNVVGKETDSLILGAGKSTTWLLKLER